MEQPAPVRCCCQATAPTSASDRQPSPCTCCGGPWPRTDPVSFSLDDAELDAMLEQLPVLAGQPRRLEDLSGGLTNRNVKVTTPDGVYVARCCDTSTSLLGIDRDNEYANSKAAERAGVGAPVFDYRPDLGI